MNLFKTLIGAIAALAIPAILTINAPASASAVNLINDGSFDDGFGSIKPGTNSNGWILGGNTEDAISTTDGTGQNFFFDYAEGSPSYLSQNVSTTIGRSYTFSFDVANIEGPGGVGSDLSAGLDLHGPDGKTLFSLTDAGEFGNPLTDSYTNYVVTFTATQDLTNLGFSLSNEGAIWILDNVSLTENDIAVTPLPGSAYLFMSGLGLIGFVAWRNKRGGFARSIAA